MKTLHSDPVAQAFADLTPMVQMLAGPVSIFVAIVAAIVIASAVVKV